MRRTRLGWRRFWFRCRGSTRPRGSINCTSCHLRSNVYCHPRWYVCFLVSRIHRTRILVVGESGYGVFRCSRLSVDARKSFPRLSRSAICSSLIAGLADCGFVQSLVFASSCTKCPQLLDTVAILFLKDSNQNLVLARCKLQCPGQWGTEKGGRNRCLIHAALRPAEQ
jgi:hypothetical protein